MKEVKIYLPDTVLVDIPGTCTVEVQTDKWDGAFIAEGLMRAIRDKVLQQARLNMLADSVKTLESGSWSRRKAIMEENRVKKMEATRIRIAKMAAKLPMEERAKLMAFWDKGGFDEYHGSKPGK